MRDALGCLVPLDAFEVRGQSNRSEKADQKRVGMPQTLISAPSPPLLLHNPYSEA